MEEKPVPLPLCLLHTPLTVQRLNTGFHGVKEVNIPRELQHGVSYDSKLTCSE